MYGEFEKTAVRARTSAEPAETNSQNGWYRDIADLGRGGMGAVHLTGYSGPSGTNKLLVIKRLRAALASDSDFLQMFLEEARGAARLEHPNIARTHEVGFEDGHYFIAREYLEGQSLAELVRRASTTGGLPLAMQLRVLADALLGLHHAHEQREAGGSKGIVHRDFSPSNIFVLYDGTVKVVDFGIAKTAYSGKTKSDIFKGKIQYVAPEQYSSRPVDRRTDIYSAGVMLWEAATQRRMWSGSNDLAVVKQIAKGQIPLPSSIEPGIPKRLEAICMRALAVRPEDRFPTAAAFRAEIESFLADLGEPFSAEDVGKFAAQISTDVRLRLNQVISEQLQLWRQETDPVSLAPVTSRTLIGDLMGEVPGAPPAARRRRPMTGFAVSGALGMLTGLAIVYATSQPSTAKPGVVAASSPQSVGGKPATVKLMPIERTRLKIETFPRSAKVGVDQAFLAANAREVSMVKDHTAHRVWAEAPGYQSRAEWVSFDQGEVSLTLTLVPAERPRSSPPAASQDAPRARPARAGDAVSTQATTPPAHDADSSARQQAGRLRLDTADPWKD